MSIILTHPRISAFYAANPHINPEEIHMQFIELLEKNTVLMGSSSVSSIPTHITNQFQINELLNLVSQFKESILSINKSILSTFLFAKRNYINEFVSLVSLSPAELQTELYRNHKQFLQSIQTAIFQSMPERTFAHKYPTVYEKLTQLTKQFNKIMQANLDALMIKSSAMDAIMNEYIANFELNAGHMVQTAQNIFLDFSMAKEINVNTIIAALSQNGEGATVSYTRIQYELSDFIKISAIAADSLEQLITRIYPAAKNVDTIGADGTVALYRDQKPTVIFSSYAVHDRNVTTEETKEFVRQTLTQNTHGILLSQYTGISAKPNFHVDIQNNNVLVYIHNAQFSADKIQMAVDMIDSISAKLGELFVSPDHRQSISKEILDDINREYQTFILQKDSFANFIKDSHRKMATQLDEFQFPSLDKYLSARYSSCKKQGYTCEICNKFSVGTLKGLAAHKRGCVRKHTSCVIPTEDKNIHHHQQYTSIMGSSM